jgi:predicted nucleic-acid-binding Zn-ribbon protein
MIKKIETRHTCILCGKKRFQRHMISFTFVSWITPVTKSRVKHWACRHSKEIYKKSCMDILRETDFNPVILP